MKIKKKGDSSRSRVGTTDALKLFKQMGRYLINLSQEAGLPFLNQTPLVVFYILPDDLFVCCNNEFTLIYGVASLGREIHQ
jgi:hypothetical protein